MFNNISKFIIVVATFVFCTNTASAQDPAFSQFYANPLYLNPAFAGTNVCPRVNLNYRDQWPGIGRTYVTTSASWDQHIRSIGGGLGVVVSQDRAGAGNLNTSHASLLYSYRLRVNNTFAMKAGFEASYRMIQLDWSNLTFGDMIDPQYGFVYPATVGDMPIGTTVRDYERDKLGYYSSFNVKFSYVIYQKIKSSYFVFFNFNVPFYYSQQPEQSNLLNANSISPEKQLNLQFNRFSSFGVGFNF